MIKGFPLNLEIAAIKTIKTTTPNACLFPGNKAILFKNHK